MKRHSPLFLIFAICLLTFPGCGDGRPKRVPVSGQVLLDGKPLTYGYVRFSHPESRASTGSLDAEGKFKLTCFDPGDGVIPGVHQVTVMGQEAIGSETIKWHAPKKYADHASSGLTQEIKGPTDSVVINLTWDGQPGPFVEKR
jgi:hypothetical protein